MGYQAKGIVIDKMFVWETRNINTTKYWMDVPQEMRQFWEPRITRYERTAVSAVKGHPHNPVDRIFNLCKPEDFCSFKLDIDAPKTESWLVDQLFSARTNTSA